MGAALTEHKVEFETSITTVTPTVRQRRLTLVLAAAVLVGTGIIAPFGAVQLRRIDGFIPATESVIVITDLLTAILLFSHARIIGSRGLLLLASGYLFSALIVLAHLLTFPGAFSPSGLLGTGLSTTAWLFIFWHLGLPVSVIGYAYLIDETRALTRSAIYWSVTCVIGLACVLTWIVTAYNDALPALFVDQIGFTPLANRVTGIVFLIAAVALVVLWLRRRSVLDQWLIVAVCALVAELSVTTFVITSRFSLGFYTQRLFSLAASTIVLSALLAEVVVLYARIAALAREAEHRTKNILSSIQATVNLSHSGTPEGLKRAIEGRIQALANVHSLFVKSRWDGAELSGIVNQELAPYLGEDKVRAKIDGPHVWLPTNTAQTIAMTLHELATNAAKYGSLSVPEGHLCVKWSPATDGQLTLHWTESGGPPTKKPTRRGFGMSAIEQMIRQEGEIRLDWRAEGLACVIVFKRHLVRTGDVSIPNVLKRLRKSEGK